MNNEAQTQVFKTQLVSLLSYAISYELQKLNEIFRQKFNQSIMQMNEALIKWDDILASNNNANISEYLIQQQTDFQLANIKEAQRMIETFILSNLISAPENGIQSLVNNIGQKPNIPELPQKHLSPQPSTLNSHKPQASKDPQNRSNSQNFQQLQAPQMSIQIEEDLIIIPDEQPQRRDDHQEQQENSQRLINFDVFKEKTNRLISNIAFHIRQQKGQVVADQLAEINIHGNGPLSELDLRNRIPQTSKNSNKNQSSKYNMCFCFECDEKVILQMDYTRHGGHEFYTLLIDHQTKNFVIKPYLDVLAIKKHYCQQCNTEYNTFSQLKQHMLNAHQKFDWFKCLKCSRKFTNSIKLTDHIIYDHTQYYQGNTREQVYQCPITLTKLMGRSQIIQHVVGRSEYWLIES